MELKRKRPTKANELYDDTQWQTKYTIDDVNQNCRVENALYQAQYEIDY